jgi:uncharacterized membrane protein YdbT with pleckstrin-like domain
MPEETIWKGTSSPWKNFKAFALLAVSIPVSIWLHGKGAGSWIYFLVLAAALWALWKWIQLKTTVFHLTTERLLTTSGILTKVTDALELYRVRDLKIIQPLSERLLGLQKIEVFTSDASSAEVDMDCVPVSLNLPDRIRKCVESCRTAKGARVMDVVEERPGDAATGQ